MEGLALDVRDVTKTFARGGLLGLLGPRRERERIVALAGVNLAVRRGEIFGLLGPNGSGKSTLVRLVATLLLPDSGQITVFGHDAQREPRAVRRLINRVSADAAFFKGLTAMENLLFTARLYGLSGRTARRRASEILARLGLDGLSLHRPLEQLSRGTQQKVAIARAFLTAPVLLLLDEPTTGLDPHSRREVQRFILEVREDHDASVLLTTHAMEEAERLSDRIAIIDEGRIVACDTPSGLRERFRLNGHLPSLEEVFLALTGKPLEEERCACSVN
jgi:ABC-2 type transport system ATP-binding protein